MRIGIFGGSFDPVHLAHLRLADACWRQAMLDRIEFTPAARQPHKLAGPIASEADRVAMLRLAVRGRPEFSVSTIEIDRGGLSFTVDTLRELRTRLPDAELFFLMGADSLEDFTKWREPVAICALATPLVVHRAGMAEPDFDSLRPFASAQRLEEIRAARVEMPPTPISSSQIRSLISERGPWELLVPPEVARYIQQRGLYRLPSMPPQAGAC